VLQHILKQTAKVCKKCLEQPLTFQYLGNIESLYF